MRLERYAHAQVEEPLAMKRPTGRIIRVTVLASTTVMVGLSTPSLAQVFKSGIDMVALTVAVTDDQGHNVTRLSADDFAVYEDGVPQQIALFGGSDIPVDVALVVDVSGSMAGVLTPLQDGADALVATLRPGDRAAVIAVHSRGDVAAPLNANLDEVRRAIRALYAYGTTALYDGVYLSLRQFERERHQRPDSRRQALVIFSDGLDNSSHVEYDDLTALAESLDVTIYTITLQEPALDHFALDEQRYRKWQMRALATGTGGLAFFPTRSTEMGHIYDTIARELVTQYLLAYVAPPGNDAAKLRHVAVSLVPPAHGVARTRTGYTNEPVRTELQFQRRVPLHDHASAGGGH
jgi:VWFA-related protein